MTAITKIKNEIQKVLDVEGDSENARAQALALFWVLELIDKYAEQEPCDDAVSRQAVLEIAKQHTLTNDYLAIQNLPSVRPQEQTGEWKFVCQHWRKCSECGFSHKFAEDWEYCPNCGAKMVEQKETETWHGIHAQITAPKGTFKRIFNESDDDYDI